MPSRNPGGSSGGTGAAVAASFAAAGMGSDTCGSIRIPSANNNLFGLRGTIGLSSRDGIIPLSHTQDIGGPLARTVTDLAVMLDVTVGADPADEVTKASAGHIPASYRDLLKPDALKGVRIGAVKDMFGALPDDEEVARSIAGRSRRWRRPAPTVVDVSLRGDRRTDAPVQRDRRRVQVRPDRVSRAPAGRAGALASARFSTAATTRRRSRRTSGAATRGPRPTRRTSSRRGRSGRPCRRR